jgi:hypothetical protein
LSGPGQFAAIGVDRAGNTLVLFLHGTDRTTIDGFWFDHDGKQQGASFTAFQDPAGHDLGDLRLVARIASGFFLQSQPTPKLIPPTKATWLASIDPLATHSDPAPAWLTSRQNTLIHPVHNGAGYAMIPVSGQQVASCQQSIEVLAPDGTSCGKADFKVDDNACTTGTLAVGYDGTVLQVRPSSRETCTPDGAHCNCTWHWWSSYFR